MVERIAGVGAPVAAAAVAVTCWTLVVLSLVTFLVADPGIDSNQLFFLVDVVGSAVYGTVAGVVMAGACTPSRSFWGRRRSASDSPPSATPTRSGRRCGRTCRGWTSCRRCRTPRGFRGRWRCFLVIPWLVRDHRLDDAARVGLVAGTLVTAWFFLARTFTDVSEVPLLAPVVAVGFVAAADVARGGGPAPVDERVGLGWLALGTALMALSFVPLMLPATVPDCG